MSSKSGGKVTTEDVADEVERKVRKLKEEGYYIGELIDSLNKIK